MCWKAPGTFRKTAPMTLSIPTPESKTCLTSMSVLIPSSGDIDQLLSCPVMR
jgi:hypothetical protein